MTRTKHETKLVKIILKQSESYAGNTFKGSIWNESSKRVLKTANSNTKPNRILTRGLISS